MVLSFRLPYLMLTRRMVRWNSTSALLRTLHRHSLPMPAFLLFSSVMLSWPSSIYATAPLCRLYLHHWLFMKLSRGRSPIFHTSVSGGVNASPLFLSNSVSRVALNDMRQSLLVIKKGVSVRSEFVTSNGNGKNTMVHAQNTSITL